MIVIPAIDLLGGKAVRLREGRRDEATVYHERPWELAAEFAAAGAKTLHVVDLDGAFDGARVHAELIGRILGETGMDVQVGGGIRREEDVEAVLGAGARYAVLGTAAVRDPVLVEKLCRRWPGQIIVAVDARDGRVAVSGWAEISDQGADELAARAVGWGAAKILYTDVSRDGLKSGPNVAATARIQQILGKTPVIASGGVSSTDDLRALAKAGVAQCVVGRALYDKVFTLGEAFLAVAAAT